MRRDGWRVRAGREAWAKGQGWEGVDEGEGEQQQQVTLACSSDASASQPPRPPSLAPRGQSVDVRHAAAVLTSSTRFSPLQLASSADQACLTRAPGRRRSAVRAAIQLAGVREAPAAAWWSKARSSTAARGSSRVHAHGGEVHVHARARIRALDGRPQAGELSSSAATPSPLPFLGHPPYLSARDSATRQDERRACTSASPTAREPTPDTPRTAAPALASPPAARPIARPAEPLDRLDDGLSQPRSRRPCSVLTEPPAATSPCSPCSPSSCRTCTGRTRCPTLTAPAASTSRCRTRSATRRSRSSPHPAHLVQTVQMVQDPPTGRSASASSSRRAREVPRSTISARP